MLIAMMKRKNLAKTHASAPSSYHTIDRGDEGCGDTERDQHANKDFIAVELGHGAPTAAARRSFRPTTPCTASSSNNRSGGNRRIHADLNLWASPKKTGPAR